MTNEAVIAAYDFNCRMYVATMGVYGKTVKQGKAKLAWRLYQQAANFRYHMKTGMAIKGISLPPFIQDLKSPIR